MQVYAVSSCGLDNCLFRALPQHHIICGTASLMPESTKMVSLDVYDLFYRVLPFQFILGFSTCTTKRHCTQDSRSTLESSHRHLQSTTITTEQEGHEASTAFMYRIHKPVNMREESSTRLSFKPSPSPPVVRPPPSREGLTR